jgi:antitoxin CptB
MEEIELKRLKWSCRRGMLENDLVLERFMERHGPGLSGTRLQAFQRLLEHDDNDLWDLVSGRTEARDPDLAEVVQLLRRS